MSAAAGKTLVLVAAVGMEVHFAEKNRMPVVGVLAGVVALVAAVFDVVVVVMAVIIAVAISETDENELEEMVVVVAGSTMVVHWEGSLAEIAVVVDVDFGEGIANMES